MFSPVRGSQTSTTQIEVSWLALTPPDTGNQPVLSYNLQWDAGTGDCTKDLIGDDVPYSQLSYMVTQGITTDTTYCFRLRAKNIYGWGDFSYLSYIRSSTSPGQMEIVQTVAFIDAFDGVSKVRISFTEPLANGEFITQY